MKIEISKLGVVAAGLFVLAPVAEAVTIQLTQNTLNNPTRAELLAGHVVNDFGNIAGLTLTVTAEGNHTNASAQIGGMQFTNAVPTANNTSFARYTFDFSSTGAAEVLGLTVLSNNNIFSRNTSSTGFQARERVQIGVTGGVFDQIIPNPGGQTGQLQVNGAGTNSGSIGINLPTQQQAAFDTSGFTAVASGSQITRLTYEYDLVGVQNGGQAPPSLETNQPFQVSIEVVPEPSSTGLLMLASVMLLGYRKK